MEQHGRSAVPRQVEPNLAPAKRSTAPAQREVRLVHGEEPVARRTRSRLRELDIPDPVGDPEPVKSDRDMRKRREDKGKARAVVGCEEDDYAMDVDDPYSEEEDDGFEHYDPERWTAAEDPAGTCVGEAMHEDKDSGDAIFSGDDGKEAPLEVYDDDDDDNIEDDGSETAFTEDDEIEDVEEYYEGLVTPAWAQECRQLHSPTQSRVLQIPRSSQHRGGNTASLTHPHRPPKAGRVLTGKGKMTRRRR